MGLREEGKKGGCLVGKKGKEVWKERERVWNTRARFKGVLVIRENYFSVRGREKRQIVEAVVVVRGYKQNDCTTPVCFLHPLF
jgi:hypothetical protein